MRKLDFGILAIYVAIFSIYCCFSVCVSEVMADTNDNESEPLPTVSMSSAAEAGGLFTVGNARRVRSEQSLGIDDRGIFSDLDELVKISLPPTGAAKVALWVNKQKRTLSVLYDDVPVKSYPIGLGFSPRGDKGIEGDGKTPEGTYFIAEKRHKNLPKKYGARSMLLSYPGVKDAVRGLKNGQISKDTADTIVRAISHKEIPPQDTPLGSSIRIHGGGVHDDWTAGCIALRDDDAKELYGIIEEGTPVHIAPHGVRKSDRDGDGIPNQVDILVGALKTDLNDAAYDGAYQPIAYPNGDVHRKKGVCTDVVIRAFRNAGIDLQQEIHRDILARPTAYAHISKPSTNIDHRRVKNMVIYMKKYFLTLPTDAAFLPGDVVLFDTLPKNGPDHIGIVADGLGPSGLLWVINNWTDGAVTDKMDLLSWVPVTHHFRFK